jgi:hypothetical protein
VHVTIFVTVDSAIPMVRCRLDGDDDDPVQELRYIPAAEFELWRHFMETRHLRSVTLDEVSVWVPETPAIDIDAVDADALDPVLCVRFEKPGPQGTAIPVVRFLRAETYPQARAALLSHFDAGCRRTVQATPGYFVPGGPAVAL